MKRNLLFWMLITAATSAIAADEAGENAAASGSAQQACTQEGTEMGYTDEGLAEFVTNCVAERAAAEKNSDSEKEQG